MKRIIFILLILGSCLIIMSSHFKVSGSETDMADTTILKASNSDAFDVVMQVVTHKRCMNCHPAGDRPRQGEDSHIHYFNVQRGEDGHGLDALQCGTCHQSENNDFSGLPGAPHWHLAPRSMAWEGLSRTEIARAILDRTKNGDRSLQDIEKHMTEDALVLWAFNPGMNNEGVAREKPPVSKEAYIQAVKQWIAEGANIPSE